MDPKISIIVPIYNVAKYLSRCLDSLIGQSIEEIEIIAVNDGSTDSSLEILKDYAVKDKRIVIKTKENGGVSSARNEGIELAKGEYVGFVDPDDWIEIDMYKVLYREANNYGAEIVMCSYIREFGTHSKEKHFPLPEKVFYQNNDVQTQIMRRLIGPINEEVSNPELLDAWGTVWSKLYRTDIIKKNNIRFTDLHKIGSNEDSLFNMEAFHYTNSFLFINNPFYHYWRANAESETVSYRPDLLQKWSNLYSLIERFIEEKGLDVKYSQALNNRIGMNTLGLGLNEVSNSNELSFKLRLRKLRNILSDYRIQQSFQQLEFNYFPLVWRFFYYCAKTKKAISFYLMLLTIEKLRRVVR
ncbi:glycosyltransferase family 2 protein [Sediminibacillus massiliensis]|uniref:glycosyltransferase family 2 protein n=1 Tax=Sediminibacillus massiliensis TaxID=1926277 RepID=UPI000988894F|nr:glycosyltransferase [Sediminibacillus massiliensis]